MSIVVGSVWEKVGYDNWGNHVGDLVVVEESKYPNRVSYRYLRERHLTAEGWEEDTFLQRFKLVSL